MKYAKYLLKLFLLIYAFSSIAVQERLYYQNIMLLLVIVGINIYKEKYNDSIYVIAANFITIAVSTFMDKSFGILLPAAAFDFAINKSISGILLTAVYEVYCFYKGWNINEVFLITFICSLFGYIIRIYEEKENSFKASLDEERRLRYELETVKAKLLNSSKEIAYLAEVRERNRIAREIHDSVGHRTAGVLFELQAAYKLMGRDDGRAKDALHKSINALSETLTLLRDTVYNIKPKENLGREYIQNIIRDFSFCPIDFKCTGDFGILNSNHMELIGTNIKEALTNAAKHSKCTEISIAIDINEVYIRLYIKDNGMGCSNIKEGLGISGMRERINNIGGSISISSDNGFMIVCIIPLEDLKVVG